MKSVVSAWFLVLGSWFLVLGSWFLEGIGSTAPNTKHQSPKKQNGTGGDFNLCRTHLFPKKNSKLVVVIDMNIQDLVIQLLLFLVKQKP